MDSGKGNTEGGHGQEVEGRTANAVKRKASSTKPTRASARLRNQWLPFEVFDNELLRKKILGYAVFSGENKLENRNIACSLRLVGKSWNETVIKLLYKRHEPLIMLSFLKSGKLESFCKTFSTSTHINGCIPPFSLAIGHLCSENVNAFWNLLTHCGQGLVQLNIQWMSSWCSCKTQFPNLPLPKLRKLEILIICQPNSTTGGVSDGRDGKETVVWSSLLDSVERDATSIDEFTIALAFNRFLSISQLSDLPLPRNITNLNLIGWMKDEHVEFLVRKPLPNLKSLTLSLKYELLGNGSFFRILDNYRASLKKLIIKNYVGSRDQTSLIGFPIMEKLKEFSFTSSNLELEPGLVSLERYLPKLMTLHVGYQSAAMLRKWTGHSKFNSVVKLQISLRNLESLSMETMQSVNFAFPNARNLDLSVVGMETSGLKYTFREMTRLTELKLIHFWREPDANPDFWDAILTGVSLETVAESRQGPGFWERFDRNEEEALESITNLQELNTLTLCGYWPSNNMLPFISDISFQRALLLMPNLKKLFLCGRFEASAEMAEVWRSEGRLLEYLGYGH